MNGLRTNRSRPRPRWNVASIRRNEDDDEDDWVAAEGPERGLLGPRDPFCQGWEIFIGSRNVRTWLSAPPFIWGNAPSK